MQAAGFAVKRGKNRLEFWSGKARIVPVHRIADEVGKLNDPASAAINKYRNFRKPRERPDLRPGRRPASAPHLHQILEPPFDLVALVSDREALMKIAGGCFATDEPVATGEEFLVWTLNRVMMKIRTIVHCHREQHGRMHERWQWFRQQLGHPVKSRPFGGARNPAPLLLSAMNKTRMQFRAFSGKWKLIRKRINSARQWPRIPFVNEDAANHQIFVRSGARLVHVRQEHQ